MRWHRCSPTLANSHQKHLQLSKDSGNNSVITTETPRHREVKRPLAPQVDNRCQTLAKTARKKNPLASSLGISAWFRPTLPFERTARGKKRLPGAPDNRGRPKPRLTPRPCPPSHPRVPLARTTPFLVESEPVLLPRQGPAPPHRARGHRAAARALSPPAALAPALLR